VGKGYYINWQMPNASIKTNPVYLKYSNLPVGLLTLQKSSVVASLGAIKVNAENAEIISYLSWLLRVIDLYTS